MISFRGDYFDNQTGIRESGETRITFTGSIQNWLTGMQTTRISVRTNDLELKNTLNGIKNGMTM